MSGCQPFDAKRSTRWGALVFGLVFFLGGSFFLVWIMHDAVLIPWRVNHRYTETTCVVVDKRISQKTFSGGVGGENAGMSGGPVTGFRPEVLIQYSVNGNNYRLWTYDSTTRPNTGYYGRESDAQEVLDHFTVDERYPCWYDPDNPGEAVLVRGYPHVWWVCFPFVFIVGGGLGILWFLLTREKPGVHGDTAHAPLVAIP